MGEHGGDVPGVANWRRIHAAWSRLISGWGRDLRRCCGPAASMRLDHRRSGVAHTRPHPAGCPGTGPAVAVSIHVRPVRAAEALQRRRHPAVSVLAANRHPVGGVLPPTFNAGWERPVLQDAPLAFACASDASLDAGRAAQSPFALRAHGRRSPPSPGSLCEPTSPRGERWRSRGNASPSGRGRLVPAPARGDGPGEGERRRVSAARKASARSVVRTPPLRHRHSWRAPTVDALRPHPARFASRPLPGGEVAELSCPPRRTAMTTATSAQPRTVRAPRGPQKTCRTWQAEAAMRMLMNNLDPEVAERPERSGRVRRPRTGGAVLGGVRRDRRLPEEARPRRDAARAVRQAGRRGDAPRPMRRGSSSPTRNLVPHWATQEHFDELARKGLIMYGQMTAGSWIYIGTQGILQGTYETFAECARQHFGGSLRGRLCVTAGCGGMGGAQPLADHDERGRLPHGRDVPRASGEARPRPLSR